MSFFYQEMAAKTWNRTFLQLLNTPQNSNSVGFMYKSAVNHAL